MGPEISEWHAETCLFAGGFRPGDVVIDTFLYHLVPAAHEIDEALNLIGCTAVPTGVGNTDTQVAVARAVRATRYVGTPSFLMTILQRAQEMGVGPLGLEVAHGGGQALAQGLPEHIDE